MKIATKEVHLYVIGSAGSQMQGVAEKRIKNDFRCSGMCSGWVVKAISLMKGGSHLNSSGERMIPITISLFQFESRNISQSSLVEMDSGQLKQRWCMGKIMGTHRMKNPETQAWKQAETKAPVEAGTRITDSSHFWNKMK